LVLRKEGPTSVRSLFTVGSRPGGCQRATRGVRTKQVGENPLRRADVEVGVEGSFGSLQTPELWLSGWRRPPSGGKRYSSCGGLPSQVRRGLTDRWSCSWITDIAEVDERHVAPELR
jgi:hypothetical protein